MLPTPHGHCIIHYRATSCTLTLTSEVENSMRATTKICERNEERIVK
jgi:hypothetical protein